MTVNHDIQAGSRRVLALLLPIYVLVAITLIATAIPAMGQTAGSIGKRLIGNHPAEIEKRRPVGRAIAHRQLRMRITFAISNRHPTQPEPVRDRAGRTSPFTIGLA